MAGARVDDAVSLDMLSNESDVDLDEASSGDNSDDDSSQKDVEEAIDDDSGSKPEWDAARQQRDENTATLSKVSTSVSQLADLVKASHETQDKLAVQLQEMLISGQKSAQPSEGSVMDDTIASAIKALDDMSPDDVMPDELVGAVRDAVKALAKRDSSSNASSELSAMQAKLEKHNELLTAQQQRLDRREALEAEKAEKTLVNSHLDALDRKYSPGKRTFRTKAVAAMLKELNAQGYDGDDNRPPGSTARAVLTYCYERLANEASAESRKANQPRVEGVDSNLLSVDDMVGGVTAKDGTLDGLSLDEVISSMRTEGKL